MEKVGTVLPQDCCAVMAMGGGRGANPPARVANAAPHGARVPTAPRILSPVSVASTSGPDEAPWVVTGVCQRR
jgi:hypothetical protein